MRLAFVVWTFTAMLMLDNQVQAVKINSSFEHSLQPLADQTPVETMLAQTAAETGTEIISLILKPFISILEKVLLGKPSVNLSGSAAEMKNDGLHAKFKKSDAKVKVSKSATYGDAPVVYQFAEQA